MASPRIVVGIIDASSGTPSIIRSYPVGSFTVTDLAVGRYRINFTPAFSDVPTVTVTPYGLGAGGISVQRAVLDPSEDPDVDSAAIEGRREDTLANIDIRFHFQAIGPI